MESQINEPGSLLEKLEEWQNQGLAPAEISQRMQRFMEYKARMKAVPIRGTFELTPLCNLDCKMCYVHLNRQQMLRDSAGLLSGQQWMHIMRQAVEQGMLEATLTGGEALLHPDFDDIILFLEENNIKVNLKTNGLLLTKERVAFLKKHHLGSVQISVYGSNDDAYERVTGKRCFGLVADAIARVKEAEIPLELIVTPNQYGWNDLEELVRFVHATGIQYSVNPGLIDPLEETGRAGGKHDLSLDQYMRLNHLMADIRGAALTPACVEDIPKTGGSVKERVEGMQCAAGRSIFSVTWRGSIHACRMLEKIGFDGLSIPFKQGWRMLNEAVQAYPFPRECIGCDFAAVCPSCVIQHEAGAEPGHANPAVCRRAYRMAAEGFYTIKKEG